MTKQGGLFDGGDTVVDITRRRHKGNRESRAAHRDNLPRAAGQRLEALRFIAGRSFQGATADEWAAYSGLPSQSCGPRFSELKKAGFIVPLFSGKGARVRRPTRNKSMAQVFILSKAGREALP